MKTFQTLLFVLICKFSFCQKDVTPQTNLIPIKEVHNTPLKSKSLNTPKPTIINVKRADIKNFTKVQDFISQIPITCDISSCELTYKKGEQIFTGTNIGNSLLICSNPSVCKFIIFENIVSNCPTLHYANYKIMIQD